MRARLSWTLMRANGRKDRRGQARSAAVVALAAVLIVLSLAARTGIENRAERTSWRTPAESSSEDATVVFASSVTHHQGTPVTVIDIARRGADTGSITVPGLDGLPLPGQTVVSAALAEAIASDRTGQLERRFPDAIEAVGPDALAHPDEWLAIRGRAPDDPHVTAIRVEDPRNPGDVAGPRHVADFTGQPLSRLDDQRQLAGLGMLLLIVPLVLMAGAATRLSSRSRSRTVAVLRLLGASTTRAVGVVTAEAVMTAGAGALLGVAAAHALLPVVARILAGDGRWFVGDLVPHVWSSVLVIVGLSTLAGLGSVRSNLTAARSPGAQTESGGRLRTRIGPRLATLVTAVAASAWLARGNDATAAAVLIGLAVAAVAVSIAGPATVSITGGLLARRRHVAARLAGRRLTHNASAAWRPVSGVGLVGFLAGLVSLFPIDAQPSPYTEPGAVEVVLPAHHDPTATNGIEQSLRAAGVEGATVERLEGDHFGVVVSGSGQSVIRVTGADNPDLARAVVEQATGWPALVAGEEEWQIHQLLGFLRTGLIVLLVSVVTASLLTTLIGAMADLMDSTATLRHLWLAGTPLEVLAHVQRLQLLVPFAVGLFVAISAGVACSVPLNLLGGTSPSIVGLTVLAGCAAATTVIAIGSAHATTSMLRSQLVHPTKTTTQGESK